MLGPGVVIGPVNVSGTDDERSIQVPTMLLKFQSQLPAAKGVVQLAVIHTQACLPSINLGRYNYLDLPYT